MEKNRLKEFAIKVGWDFLEVLMVVGFGIISFPFILKFMWWFASLFGYSLI